MKKLSLLVGLLLCFLSAPAWSQISWEPVEEMTIEQLSNESMKLSMMLVDLSEISFQTFLTFREESTALRNQLTSLDEYRTSLEAQLVELRKQVSSAVTKAQKAESSLTVSTELIENLQKDLRKARITNILLITGGTIIIVTLTGVLIYSFTGG